MALLTNSFIQFPVCAVTEFCSMYESHSALTTINKQHMVEWFSGSVLNSRWTQSDVVGCGTFAMVDTVCEGFSIKNGACTGDQSALTFNDKRQYAHDGSVLIAIVKRITDATANHNVGLAGGICKQVPNNSMTYRDATSICFKSLQVRNTSGTQATTASDVAVDTAWTGIKLEADCTNNILSLAGVVKVTSSTNISSAKMQPFSTIVSTGSGAKETRIKYMEAYNT